MPEIIRLHLAGNAPRTILKLLDHPTVRDYYLTETNIAYILKKEGVYRPMHFTPTQLERGAMRRMHRRDVWLHADPEMIYRETEGTDW